MNLSPSSFASLLYRYFFFGWLFRDASRGSQLERAAAWRHNREAARWLSTYLLRWIVLMAIFVSAGAFAEKGFELPLVSALFYVPACACASVNAVISAAILGFKVLP